MCTSSDVVEQDTMRSRSHRFHPYIRIKQDAKPFTKNVSMDEVGVLGLVCQHLNSKTKTDMKDMINDDDLNYYLSNVSIWAHLHSGCSNILEQIVESYSAEEKNCDKGTKPILELNNLPLDDANMVEDDRPYWLRKICICLTTSGFNIKLYPNCKIVLWKGLVSADGPLPKTKTSDFGEIDEWCEDGWFELFPACNMLLINNVLRNARKSQPKWLAYQEKNHVYGK